MPATVSGGLRRFAALGLILLIALASPLAPARAGDLAVHITDTDGQPLANTAIMASWQGAPVVSGADQTAEVTQKNLMFHPHVLIIPVGTSVNFPNHDRTRHQVYSFSKAKTFNIKLYVGRPQRPIVFDKTGVVTLGCDIHDYMQAFIVVTNRPRRAITNDKGLAILHDLPGKPVHLSIWHPWMPNEDQRVQRKITRGTRSVNVKLDLTPPATAPRRHKTSLQDQFDQLSK